MFHPVLVTWDNDAQKCIGSLEPIRFGVITSVEFKLALKKGYVLNALHRLDKYAFGDGLWNDFVKSLYIEKMANSEETPSLEKQADIIEQYSQEVFNMGEAVEESFPRWADSPAKRQVFKIMINSGWGKHCQRPNLPHVQIVWDNDADEISDLFSNAASATINIKSIAVRMMVKSEKMGVGDANFHDAYLPAGLFVPAYGRIMLYEQRVLYHDTDSVIYIYDPLLYNIPESDTWGSWSVEKFDLWRHQRVCRHGSKVIRAQGRQRQELHQGQGSVAQACPRALAQL